jgi:hypothetical protein
MATRAKFGESGESAQNRLANVGESGECGTFLKKAILASIQIRQKWRISGEYSNSQNVLASGHCLVKTLKVKLKSKAKDGVTERPKNRTTERQKNRKTERKTERKKERKKERQK